MLHSRALGPQTSGLRCQVLPQLGRWHHLAGEAWVPPVCTVLAPAYL